MKPEKFSEAEWLKKVKSDKDYWHFRNAYLKRRQVFLKFDFPKYFYFKVLNDRCAIHWAVIREENKKKFVVYFININGRAFDTLEFKSKKQAQRALRRNKFNFSTNKKCPYLPINSVYVNLATGRKSAPYSHPKGSLWDFDRKCEANFDRFIKSYSSKANKKTIMYLYMDTYPQMIPQRLQEEFIRFKNETLHQQTSVKPKNKFKWIKNISKVIIRLIAIYVAIIVALIWFGIITFLW